MKKTLAKRGNVSLWISVPVALAVGVISIVVVALILQAFKTASIYCPSGYMLNSTSQVCHLATNVSATATTTTAGLVTDDGGTFIDNVTSQFSTAGTILGVSLLLLIIAGVGFGAYAAYKKYR